MSLGLTRHLPPWAWRLLRVVPVVLGIALLNFLILQLAPGDVVDVLAGEAGAATPEYMAELRARFGLDQALPAQLLQYLWNTVRLDLGYSFRHNLPVRQLILDRLPATVLLMVLALLIAVTAGIALGTLAATRVRSALDHAISLLVLLAYALPSFWLGLMAIVVFSAQLGWLPTGGMVDISAAHTGWRRWLDIGHHAVLPACTLATFYLAVFAKLTRSALLELHGADFMRTARAKGASAWRVTVVHGLRNALLPVVTVLGYQVAALLSGAVLVESVFSWPGLGRLAFESILSRDFNLLLGILFLSALLVTTFNLLIDLAYTWLDPRIGDRSARTPGSHA